eukprot:UN01526
MDHLITSFGVLRPDIEGNSTVEFNLTTIVRLPFKVLEGLFVVDDPNNIVYHPTFTLLEDCHHAYVYVTHAGYCKDTNSVPPNAIYASVDRSQSGVCQNR